MRKFSECLTVFWGNFDFSCRHLIPYTKEKKKAFCQYIYQTTSTVVFTQKKNKIKNQLNPDYMVITKCLIFFSSNSVLGELRLCLDPIIIIIKCLIFFSSNTNVYTDTAAHQITSPFVLTLPDSEC